MGAGAPGSGTTHTVRARERHGEGYREPGDPARGARPVVVAYLRTGAPSGPLTPDAERAGLDGSSVPEVPAIRSRRPYDHLESGARARRSRRGRSSARATPSAPLGTQTRTTHLQVETIIRVPGVARVSINCPATPHHWSPHSRRVYEYVRVTARRASICVRAPIPSLYTRILPATGAYRRVPTGQPVWKCPTATMNAVLEVKRCGGHARVGLWT